MTVPDKTQPVKAVSNKRTRKGVSDKTLFKYIKLAQERFDVSNEDSVGVLLDSLRDAVMEDILQ